jgi:hypothetical protein
MITRKPALSGSAPYDHYATTAGGLEPFQGGVFPPQPAHDQPVKLPIRHLLHVAKVAAVKPVKAGL